ncbi:MAG: sigma-54 interaction domain-containing protein [Candidatus Acidiferrales bacterium]
MATATAPFREASDTGFELPPDEILFGSLEAMRAIRQSLARMAGTNVSILLQGQSGTGKEVLARYIHEQSPAGSGAFVKVNCPAIPGTLFESELFGYQRGAFTGAFTSKPGRVEMAHGGTLFLDEIAELEPGMQAKLLQVLQDGQFSRIGAQEERQVNVRVICATNRHLEQEIRAGNFRQDLFFRINVVSVELPALKDRKDDIPVLVEYFLDRYTRMFRRAASHPSSRLMKILREHHWPGNIRELENLVKRYVILGSEDAICKALQMEEASDDSEVRIPDGPVSLKQLTRQAVKQVEKRVILGALEANHWNRRVVSRALGISYAALLYKMREAGVPPRQSRKGWNEIAASAAPAASTRDVHSKGQREY